MIYDLIANCYNWVSVRDSILVLIHRLWRQLGTYQSLAEINGEEAARFLRISNTSPYQVYNFSLHQLHQSQSRTYRRRARVTWQLLRTLIRWALMEGLMSLPTMDDPDEDRREWLAARDFSTSNLDFSI